VSEATMRKALIGVGVVAVVVAAYLVGRMQDAADSPGQATAPPEAAAPASTTATALPTAGKGSAAATSTAALPAGHPTAPAGQTATPISHQGFVQFQVGQRNIKALLSDGPAVWLGTSGGVVHYNPTTDRHQTINNRNGLLSNGVFYLGKRGNDLLVGTYGGGLSVLDTTTSKWRNYNIPNGMADAFVYDVLMASSGDIWIATWSGANRIVGGDLDNFEKWQLYTVENTDGGLPNDWVYGLAEGKSGEIWLATEGGLARFVDDEWTHWDHEDGLGAPYDLVKSETKVGSDPGQVSGHHALQKQQQGLGGIADAYNPNYIVSMAVDGDGRVWAGTWGGGLSRFDGAAWKTFTDRDGLPGNHVFALEMDSSGRIWIGTNRGLARYDGKSFVTFGRQNGLYSDNVFSISFAPDGGTWIGSFGGLTWYPKGIDVASGAKVIP